MKTIKFNFFLFFLITATVFAAPTNITFTLNDVAKMSVEERYSIFHDNKIQYIADHNDFLPLIILGVKDEDAKVRHDAVATARFFVGGLQEMKFKGKPITFDISRLPDLQNALIEKLSDPDHNVRMLLHKL